MDKENGEMKNVEMLLGEGMPVVSEEVTYFGDVKGLYVKPKKEGTYPGVVMIHENRGLRPEIQARVLTADFNQATGTANMRAAVKYLRNQGVAKIASLGWCFGGRQSVELAISGEKLDATVVYYGGRMATSTDRLSPIKWPVLGIFGDQDQSIPLEMIEDFRTSLNTLGVQNEIHVYPGVGHAFANPSGMNYAPNETKDAWEKTLDFLARNLKN
jgi:carboxymethylenebutenolidase